MDGTKKKNWHFLLLALLLETLSFKQIEGHRRKKKLAGKKSIIYDGNSSFSASKARTASRVHGRTKKILAKMVKLVKQSNLNAALELQTTVAWQTPLGCRCTGYVVHLFQ
jgi:hypothetical protein